MNARKRCHRHGVAGDGKRDDTPVHSLPQSRPLADPAPSEREPWVRAFIFSTILSLQAQHNKPSPFRGRCPAGADEVEAAFSKISDNGALASSTSSVSAFGRASFPCKGKPLGVYHVLTHFVNRVPSQRFGGSKPPPYGARFICLPVGTPLPGRPENVAIGTVLPGKAYGIPPTPHPARGGFLLR